MRCKLCKERAIYTQLRFCKEHFLKYYEKKARHYLDRLRMEGIHLAGKRILVGVSGGKDSSALAHILKKLKDDYQYELELFSIHLRIPAYSEEGVLAAQKLAKQLDVPIIVWDLDDHPKQIPDFTKAKDGRPAKPCSQCGTIKRYLLNKAAIDGNFDFVVTGHNLDDEYYFAMHSLYGQDVDQLLRSDKWLPPRPEHKLAGRLKPLYYLTEKENMIYCLLNKLPVHNEECPYSKGNPQIAFKHDHAGVPRMKKANLLRTIRKMKRKIESNEHCPGAKAGSERSREVNDVGCRTKPATPALDELRSANDLLPDLIKTGGFLGRQKAPLSERKGRGSLKEAIASFRGLRQEILTKISSWGGGRPETIRPEGRGIVSANKQLNHCPHCDYPTTRDDACVFCRLMGTTMETNKKDAKEKEEEE